MVSASSRTHAYTAPIFRLVSYVMTVPAQPTFKKAKAAAVPVDEAGPAPVRAAEDANPGRPALGFMPNYDDGVPGVFSRMAA